MTSTDLWVLIAILLSGLVSGVTGFGFGLVSMGLLVTILPVTQATVLVSVLFLCVTLLNLWTLRKDLCWRESLPVLVTGVPFIALGVYLLQILDVHVLRIGVAVMILAGCALLVWSPKQARLSKPFPWAYVAGILGGTFGGTLGMGGPPVVLYTQLRGFDKLRCKSLLCGYFLVIGVWRVVLLALSGLVTMETARMSLLLFVPSMAATYAGIYLFKRMSTPVFRYATMLVMIGLAVKLFVN
jgi:uncharacterized membrane protein YfcA